MKRRQPDQARWYMAADPRSEVPVYEQIKSSVMESAGKGLMAGGTVLPSIHKLSHMPGVAPGAVARAYRELRAPGIITSGRGKAIL